MVLLDNGGRPRAELDLAAPPADLTPLVEHLWIQDCARLSGDWRVVPDLAPHLLAIVSDAGGARTIRVVVVGPRSCAVSVDAANRVLTAGVRLQPGVLRALTGVPACELADRAVAIDQLFPARTLADLEIGPDTPAPHLLHELIRLTRRTVRGRLVASPLLPDAASLARRVDRLAACLGTPTRSLRDRAHREIGLGPKRMLRVLRLHAALHIARRSSLSGAPLSWTQVAYAAGYADQPHLTRELRALLGETPVTWAARGTAATGATRRTSPTSTMRPADVADTAADAVDVADAAGASHPADAVDGAEARRSAVSFKTPPLIAR